MDSSEKEGSGATGSLPPPPPLPPNVVPIKAESEPAKEVSRVPMAGKASQLGTFLKFDEAPETSSSRSGATAPETSSSRGGVTAPGATPVRQLPWLNRTVADSMFFC
ncbi:protein argonaute 4-like [Durio zibethinus]|uniref:Protein argonaute 4-like n=1 Tax=Durio zibethinus TaxID=66656 RepID=A0A6P5XXH2_DURZI|nr:protein argonaute 4-like [Durio zibethinus]XP_022716578.1 protein argonaute 4-like [Durio zibethinus]XP_022716579.1 protein argonaute 4-like [Durio zibethinus]XP_022728611.1 protein argonaute 4-like [Durio zibethinus]XP_022728612.1 protein argonaute 4-like [Durio zibethinus]XP_022728613.1 protein argonaute 4-like [Durio zibethinus]XP_022728614.1 protein argonaute 4-like [Durio zibethinus]XP_022728616.1 protein argonaute 4-like [Durio zibethinus]XP_022728617.1 protein argonaute 4-like [Du